MSQAGLNNLGAGASGITTIDGDTGSATGTTVTIFASNITQNCGSSVLFTNGSATSTLNVTDANGNTLIGLDCGNATISGTFNTGLGQESLLNLTTGAGNTAVGTEAAKEITTGLDNTCVGNSAGKGMTESAYNACFGYSTGFQITTGSWNTLLGYFAGQFYTSTESSNILLSNSGVVGESNIIRIGTQGTGSGEQNACYIAGIAGVTVASSAAVLIDTATGQLGTVSSSMRYKENIDSMGKTSVLDLNPVTFSYKNDPTHKKQYGLIAEQVNEIFPDLVIYDKEGRPDSVAYHTLPVLLLNEIKILKQELATLKEKFKS